MNRDPYRAAYESAMRAMNREQRKIARMTMDERAAYYRAKTRCCEHDCKREPRAAPSKQLK